MTYEWNEGKRRSNLQKHGVDFSQMSGFEWETALTIEDTRRDYGETRSCALGIIDTVLHAVVFTVRGTTDTPIVRVISLRKTNQRERKSYETRRQESPPNP